MGKGGARKGAGRKPLAVKKKSKGKVVWINEELEQLLKDKVQEGNTLLGKIKSLAGYKKKGE